MYKTFDGEEIQDGWYTAQYKTDREVVFVHEGILYTGLWLDEGGSLCMLPDDTRKHHDFREIYSGWDE